VCCWVDEDIVKRKVMMIKCKIMGLRWEECRENWLKVVQHLNNVFCILGEILVKIAVTFFFFFFYIYNALFRD
jgi:hypothetical protein